MSTDRRRRARDFRRERSIAASVAIPVSWSRRNSKGAAVSLAPPEVHMPARRAGGDAGRRRHLTLSPAMARVAAAVARVHVDDPSRRVARALDPAGTCLAGDGAVLPPRLFGAESRRVG